MNLLMLGIELKVNENNYKMNIDLRSNVKDNLLNDIKFNITKGSNTIDVSLQNCGNKDADLNSLSIHLATFRFDSKSICVLNDEDPSKDIQFQPLEESKNPKEFISYLFGMVLEEQFSSNYLFAFLRSHSSKVCIKYIIKDNTVKVYAVYFFGLHKLLPNQTIKLDTLYIEEGNDPFCSFNNYIDAIDASYKYKELTKIEADRRTVEYNNDDYNVLFTKKPCSYSIKVNSKPIILKLNKETMYPLDIATKEGQDLVFQRVQQLRKQGGNIVCIKYVNLYLEELLNLKACNPYYELNNLLLELRNEFEDIIFYFDNCPLGIAIGNNAILEQELELNKKQGMIKRLVKKRGRYSINYNFIAKMMLKRSILEYTTKFNVNNNKVKALLEAITGNLNTKIETYSKLRSISSDIDAQFGVIPYFQSEDIFGFVTVGKEAIYIAIFNLSESPVKFYCDLSMKIQQFNLDGVVNEVFTDTDYLVSNGKLYIRKFPAMDCCLFKKVMK